MTSWLKTSPVRSIHKPNKATESSDYRADRTTGFAICMTNCCRKGASSLSVIKTHRANNHRSCKGQRRTPWRRVAHECSMFHVGTERQRFPRGTRSLAVEQISSSSLAATTFFRCADVWSKSERTGESDFDVFGAWDFSLVSNRTVRGPRNESDGDGMTANWTRAHFDKSWPRIWSLKDAGLSTAYLCDLLEGGS